jgi:hypothetical protein
MRIFGFELTRLHYGVTEQHIIGRIFQPSVFGVFLIWSIYAFLCERPFLATFVGTFAAIIHPAYLLSAAVLTSSYAIMVFGRKRANDVGTIGSVSSGGEPVVCFTELGRRQDPAGNTGSHR